MNVKNNIVKPVLITFLVMLLLLVAVFSVLHFFFPLTLSNWFYSMGANNMALNYLERSYNKTENYNQLYSLVNLSIKTNKYEKVEKYYEIFYENENYGSFVLTVDAKNLMQENSNLIKSSLYSEDNYLKNKYVLALTKQQKTQKAFNFALNNSSFSVSLDELGVYIFTNIFVEGVNFDEFENLQEFSNNLENYFNQNYKLFNECANEQNLQPIKGLVLGSRINEIANNLKVIKAHNENFVTLTNEQINNMVLSVNKTMAVFV